MRTLDMKLLAIIGIILLSLILSACRTCNTKYMPPDINCRRPSSGESYNVEYYIENVVTHAWYVVHDSNGNSVSGPCDLSKLNEQTLILVPFDGYVTFGALSRGIKEVNEEEAIYIAESRAMLSIPASLLDKVKVRIGKNVTLNPKATSWLKVRATCESSWVAGLTDSLYTSWANCDEPNTVANLYFPEELVNDPNRIVLWSVSPFEPVGYMIVSSSKDELADAWRDDWQTSKLSVTLHENEMPSNIYLSYSIFISSNGFWYRVDTPGSYHQTTTIAGNDFSATLPEAYVPIADARSNIRIAWLTLDYEDSLVKKLVVRRESGHVPEKWTLAGGEIPGSPQELSWRRNGANIIVSYKLDHQAQHSSVSVFSRYQEEGSYYQKSWKYLSTSSFSGTIEFPYLPEAMYNYIPDMSDERVQNTLTVGLGTFPYWRLRISPIDTIFHVDGKSYWYTFLSKSY